MTDTLPNPTELPASQPAPEAPCAAAPAAVEVPPADPAVPAVPKRGKRAKPARAGGQHQQSHQQSQQPPRTGKRPARPAERPRPHHPMLDQLAEHFPALFGARFRPLKLGTYEDIQARHPGVFEPEALKLALGQHARSTRYLESVAAGDPRCDLDGQPVEDVSPEHRQHAIMEVFRRRQVRTQADLKPWVLERLAAAIQASGLTRADYMERIRTQDPQQLALLDEAFDAITQQAAKREALRRAYAASGKSVEDFADMYGMDVGTVREALAP